MSKLGNSESPAIELKLIGLSNVVPLSVLLLKNVSVSSEVALLFSHTTYTLLPDVIMNGNSESPALVLKLIGLSNVVPLSVLLLKNMSRFPVVALLFSHTTYTLLPDVIMNGNSESPAIELK